MTGKGGIGEELLLRLLQGQQEQLTRLSGILERQSEIAGRQNQGRTLVDTKAIGRQENLGGSLEEASRSWKQCSYCLELWLARCPLHLVLGQDSGDGDQGRGP